MKIIEYKIAHPSGKRVVEGIKAGSWFAIRPEIEYDEDDAVLVFTIDHVPTGYKTTDASTLSDAKFIIDQAEGACDWNFKKADNMKKHVPENVRAYMTHTRTNVSTPPISLAEFIKTLG